MFCTHTIKPITKEINKVKYITFGIKMIALRPRVSWGLVRVKFQFNE